MINKYGQLLISLLVPFGLIYASYRVKKLKMGILLYLSTILTPVIISILLQIYEFDSAGLVFLSIFGFLILLSVKIWDWTENYNIKFKTKCV